MPRILKRARGKNFSEAEERILFQLVENHKDIVLNKKSDAATWKLKAETWAKICEEFCTQSGVVRSWEALRDKYTNTKRKERRCNGDMTLASSVSSPSEEANDANENLDFNPSMTDFKGKKQKSGADTFSQDKCGLQEGRNKLWEEKIKMQRDYYRDENARLAEKHRIDMEKQAVELHGLRLKNQLLELQIEERKKRG
ncbi:uncharacterized protein LOC111078565 [Drosophila obscura]|uniref:uncharacterized protein LOC111078565 n=1 Tax=Drosophila obscura TaxID=7282 RepID=UPI001BB0F6A3|nr:uncharacterized protein LOC111078565 [Drosophila obscura]